MTKKFVRIKIKKVRGQQESNQRPQDLQSYALPLSYDPGELALRLVPPLKIVKRDLQ